MTELDLYKVDIPEDRQRKVYTRLVDATFEVCDMRSGITLPPLSLLALS